MTHNSIIKTEIETETTHYEIMALYRTVAIISGLLAIASASGIFLAAILANAFQWDNEKYEPILGFLVLVSLLLALVYAVCTIVLSVLTRNKMGCFIAFVINLCIPLVFIFFSLYVLMRTKEELRKAGYTVGFIRTDLKHIAGSEEGTSEPAE